MSMRISVVTAVAGLAAAAALSACGAVTSTGGAAAPATSPAAPAPATSSPPATTAPSSPPVVAPNIIAVQLDTVFTPASIAVAAGMKFQVIVSPSVTITGPAFPAQCGPGTSAAVAAGMLSVSCPATSSYLFTAEHAGTTNLTVSVRPHCAPGQMCPQWIKEASLHVTIT